MQQEMGANKRLKSMSDDAPIISSLFQRTKKVREGILAAAHGKDFSNTQELVWLPVPTIAKPPGRFRARRRSNIMYFTYLGRTGYTRFRNTVLALCKVHRLPVEPDEDVFNDEPLYEEAALWGTMGSGKSFMLAALACDLIATFSSSSDGEGFQKQRVVYLPECKSLVHSLAQRIQAFQNSLFLAYADDDKTLERIAMISDDSSLADFFDNEAQNGVYIYLLVDQVNDLNLTQMDTFVRRLTKDHLLVTSASANNENAQRWYAKSELDIAVVFHHGGLDAEEFEGWKKHFSGSEGSPTALGLLTAEQEQRVKDATGCVPLFLHCWSQAQGSTPEKAWQSFISMREVRAAESNLKAKIESQLHDEVHQQTTLQMYLEFLTQGRVSATPEHYDCRYLYVQEPNGIGRYVCGVYRDLIAEILQRFRRLRIAKHEWRGAIVREAQKENPNPSVLGFMVEQEMISEILENGIPLYVNAAMRCNKVCYFKSGYERELEIEEGCVLYVPSAFNYHRVDAIIREYLKSKSLYNGPADLESSHLVEIYDTLQLRVAGVQITLGSLDKHLHSENEFFHPDVLKVWYHEWDKKDVAKWFIWYVLRAEMEKHTRNAEEVLECTYGSGNIRGKTRATAAKVQELGHVTILFPLEQYEPHLESLRKTESK